MSASLIKRLRFENPILTKDLLTRMRGAKAFIIQGIYVGIMLLILAFTYLNWSTNNMNASPVRISSELGKLLYQIIFQTQAAFICLITPALSAGAITIEHEQRTYELLACSRIAPRNIIVGKLLSAWLFVMILLTCSIPLAALCLMFGGVSVGEIIWSYIVLALCGFFFGSIGIFFSSLVQRSAIAVVATYATVFAYLFGTLILQVILMSGGAPWGGLGSLNPFIFIAMTGETLKLFSTSVPGWLPCLVLLPLTSLLLLNWSITRLPNFVISRALVIRLLLITLTAAVTLLAAGGPTTAWSTDPLVLTGITGTILLIGGAALFITGTTPEPQPRSLLGWLLSGLNPLKIFTNELRGGFGYLLLLAAVFVAAFFLGGHWAGATTYTASSGFMRFNPAAPVTTSRPLDFYIAWHFFVLLASGMFIASAFGALGAALRSKVAGVVFVLVALAVALAVPGGIWMQYGFTIHSGTPQAGSLYYLIYLAPYPAVSTMLIPKGYDSLPTILRPPAPPVWFMTSMLYILLAFIILGLAELVYQAQRRTKHALVSQPVQAES
jgi:ABC-type transport system involved in multi-copper enzyme maturation permease subunit